MFDSQQKSTGTGYTTTVALLAAFIFIPAVFVISGSFIHSALLLEITCSAFCVVCAWIYWKKSSGLCIPSIDAEVAKAK